MNKINTQNTLGHIIGDGGAAAPRHVVAEGRLIPSVVAAVMAALANAGRAPVATGVQVPAALVTEVLNAVSFLGLSQTYQYMFQGALILAAALIYSTARRQTNA